jgi:hypothetical protein
MYSHQRPFIWHADQQLEYHRNELHKRHTTSFYLGKKNEIHRENIHIILLLRYHSTSRNQINSLVFSNMVSRCQKNKIINLQ